MMQSSARASATRHRSILYRALFFVVPFAYLLWSAPAVVEYLEENHGWALAGARQVTFGRFPFADLICAWGPLAFLTSASGLWIHNSLVPETIICAAGFSTTVLFIHLICDEYMSALSGAIAPIVTVALVPAHRLFRWPQWLFGVLTVYWVVEIARAGGAARRQTFIAGCIAGTAWLFRIDFGIVALACCAAAIVLLSWRSLHACGRALAMLLLGFASPIALFLAALIVHGGSVLQYLEISVRYSYQIYRIPEVSAVQGPHWTVLQPLSLDSGTALAFTLIPLTALACLIAGGRLFSSDPTRPRPRAVALLAIGAMAFLVFPSAHYYPNVNHFLFILPVALLSFAGAMSAAWQGALVPARSGTARVATRAGVIVFCLAGALVVWDIQPETRQREARPNLKSRYAELAAGVGSPEEHPLFALAEKVQQLSAPDDYILLLPDSFDSHVLFFADRRHSAADIVVNPFLLNDPLLKRLNYASILQHPPKLVIAHRVFFENPERFKIPQPDLYAYIVGSYPRVLAQAGNYTILGRNDQK